MIKILATLSLVFSAASLLAGDTGTYKIESYEVKLIPHSDGKVEIGYRQKWQVTGGHIPWITVGMANGSFDIVKAKWGGAVKKIGSEESYVRIDLDRDYKPGQSFEVFFSVVQHKLFYADKENYKLDFTPGWYDNAQTGKMRLEVFFFAKTDAVKTSPKPSKIEGQSMIWEKSGLGKGEKFSISVSFPKKLLAKEMASTELQASISWGAVIIIIVVIIIIIIILAAAAANFSDGDGYGGGGGIFLGGIGNAVGEIFSGGGGGFGGRSSSCACACVSCACACACAGGGGAGCDRKQMRRRSLCRECPKQSICLASLERSTQ